MQSLGGLERVLEILQASSPSSQPGARIPAAAPRGLHVVLDRVSFSYPNRPEELVLDEVSISLEPGIRTALVGPSGSGKTSLVSLLLGFYRPTSGTLRLDGRDLGMWSEEELTGSIGWVPQEPALFGFTVYQNLVFGNPAATRDLVASAIAKWRFLDFVERLPHGLDTTLGEHGTQLSGGQRQRLAIAIALLRRPALLVLDEATSGLDSETEGQVFDAIRSDLPETTVLIISHRLSTVRDASKVYVISMGRIVEEGTHEELRKGRGLYEQYVIRQALG
jgi:ATP-binding cassette subfamily B protein